MEMNDWTTILISIIAVVFVFLFGIEKFSKQVQGLFGERFKNLLQKYTDNPVKGAFIGALITSILQSSTAMSVLLVSLTEGGLLSLTSSLGLIIGANVGTTITSQLVAFNLLKLAPYILVAGFLLMNIKNKFQRYGRSLFYFGLIFSSLYIISTITIGLQNSTEVINLIEKTSNIYIAIIIGFIISNLFQSSSVTTSLLVILAGQGLIGLEQSIGIILGANIGTTTTALVASIVTGKQGKRVALGHFIFNFGGVLILLPFIGLFIKLVSLFSDGNGTQVAMAHLIFNLITAIVFLLLFKYYEKMVHWIIKS